MSVELLFKEESKSKIPFPKIMRNKHTDLCVLFRISGSGAILNGVDAGKYRNDFNMDVFVEVEGSITLSNKG